MSKILSVGDLAEHLGAELSGGDPQAEITGAAPLESAGSAQISFLARRKYLPYLSRTEAAAVLVERGLGAVEGAPEGTALLWVDDAYLALADALTLLYPEQPGTPGVAPTARVEDGVELGVGVTIGHYAVVGAGAQLAEGVRVGAHSMIGARCRIGARAEIKDHVTLYPNTVLGARCIVHSGARIGVDGYGYVEHEGSHRKIPQVGRCVIEDDVEVGANCTIDRGSVGETRVGAGTKIDNLVHLAHNVQIGRNCLIVAQVGIAGSTVLGDGVALAGQVGIVGHREIGDGARVGAQSGVSSDIEAGETYFGYPARPHTRVMRANAVFLKLPELLKRVRRLERRLATNDRNGSREHESQE